MPSVHVLPHNDTLDEDLDSGLIWAWILFWFIINNRFGICVQFEFFEFWRKLHVCECFQPIMSMQTMLTQHCLEPCQVVGQVHKNAITEMGSTDVGNWTRMWRQLFCRNSITQIYVMNDVSMLPSYSNSLNSAWGTVEYLHSDMFITISRLRFYVVLLGVSCICLFDELWLEQARIFIAARFSTCFAHWSTMTTKKLTETNWSARNETDWNVNVCKRHTLTRNKMRI